VSEFPASKCNGFVFEPRFRCEGGSALVATLEADVQPWQPFVQTDVRAFLAFDREQELVAVDAYIESGER